MESKARSAPAKSHLPVRWLTGLAAAAAIVLGLFVFLGPGSTPALAQTTPPVVQRDALDYLQSPLFKFDLKNEQHAALFKWLQNKQLPAPNDLPPGLKNIPGLGCRELSIGKSGVPASLVCFKPAGGSEVHLVILEKKRLNGELPASDKARENCHGCSQSGWASSHWSDGHYAYFIFAKRKPDELAALF